jgi:hypothetical protein
MIIGAANNSPTKKTIKTEMLFLPNIRIKVLRLGENSAAPLTPVILIKEAHPPQNPSMILGNN